MTHEWTIGCTTRDMACEPCVSQLTSSDQLTTLLSAVSSEPEPIVTLTHLLRRCRDEHRLLWEQYGDGEMLRHVAAAVGDVTHVLPEPGTCAVLGADVRSALTRALGRSADLPTVFVARALAELIDQHYSHTFASWFRREGVYRPGAGDPIPLGTPDLRQVMAMRATSPPWRLAQRLDETRHVRLAGDWAVRFRIVFDYSLFDRLAGLITGDTVLATIHPNQSLDEFALNPDAAGRVFPVQPRDVEQQRRVINSLLDQAAQAGASIVTLPELSVTPELAVELRERVERPLSPFRILVAGSYHHEEGVGADAPQRRRNTAVAWVRGHDQALAHDKHSPADEPVPEGIRPDGWPELRVYVTADGWHLSIAVCRDLLNPQAANALAESGVNLLLVPAMSETLIPFGGPVAHLVGTRQALVVIANNPSQWPRDDRTDVPRPARALFGHPGLGQQARLVQAPELSPGVALMHVSSAAITWLIDELPTRTEGPPRAGEHPRACSSRPSWVESIARHHEVRGPRRLLGAGAVQLRRAAVLVLLGDGPSGPSVVLTERAGDLADYPNQLVFPGGAGEPGDADAVATALREAREEIGLDPRTVEVIGLLAPRALPESGFLVDPVLAWSTHAVFDGPVNQSEVVCVREVALRDVAARKDVGRMTASVVDDLLNLLE